MAVEFYDINDRSSKIVLFSLNDQDFEALEPVLNEYKKKTGLIIDQYGNTRIHSDHTRLIVDLIDEYLSNSRLNNRLLEIKEKLRNIKCDLLAVGD
jgi:hypothetical protein